MTEDGQTTPARRIEDAEDSDLLRAFADSGSQDAFAKLVRRRIDFVYSVALRQTGGDRHRAEDATQAVFTDLARKARTLAVRPVLVGWLYHSARFAAASLVRTEQRRQSREQEAHTMQTVLTDSARDAEWQQVRPVLDQALNEINERDRDAILLRYFDGRSFPEIGARLRLTENAARMRVERALEQLDVALRKRGITSTASALAAAVGVQVTAASPAGLATAVTGTALAQASLGTIGWVPAVLGVGTLPAAIAVAVVAAGAAGYVWQRQLNAALRTELAGLAQQQQAVAGLRIENERIAATAAEVELLRRDDAEFKRLSQQAADTRNALQEKARLARQREERLATERNVQAEIDRMNREGNALVVEYKALTSRSKDAALSDPERANAAAAAKLKLGEIQAKQGEIKAFIAAARAANPELNVAGMTAQYRTAESVKGEVAGRLSLRAAADSANPGATREPDRISLSLPNADFATAVSALEKISGTRIVRDPSLAAVAGTLTLNTDRVTRGEAITVLQAGLRERFNVVFERMPDGTLLAKLGSPR